AFSIRRSRIYLTSNVSPSIRGRVMFEVKPEKTEALDAYFEFKPKIGETRPLMFKLGQFKKPFSYQEFVMSSSDLNLIERTFTHAFLENKIFASSRDQGLMVAADLWDSGLPVILSAGVFNGNGKNVKFDTNSGKQVVGRVEATPFTGVSIGANGTFNHRGYASDSTNTQDYVVWGADLVLAKSGFQIVSEVFGGDNTELLGSAESQVFPDDVPSFFAWYAEAIYRARGGWEPAVRFEIFDPDQDIDDDGRQILTGQIAYSFSPNFRWQVNVASENFEDDALEDLTAVISQWTIRL
ncbi:MAG TPA: hypothetical protein VFP10_15100, partial [Candidatus Eisenbacteria bacterium]|nr:hypothetical protein [Candidatus Eisenbacteria bacterium]